MSSLRAVVGIDASPTMLAAAREAAPEIETHLADHRPLQAYADAIAQAGLLIELLREPAVPEAAIVAPRSRRWQRVPLFLHARAVKPG